MDNRLPPALLEALATMTEGGVIPVVEQASLLPCFIMRVPATTHQLQKAELTMTTRMVLYDEGPLVVLHFNLFDQPAGIHPTFSMRRPSIEIHPARPLHLETFLHPAEGNDRLVLEALARSESFKVEFYFTDPAMSYQATKQYALPQEQQKAAQAILEETAEMHFDSERFSAAIARFTRENSLFE